MRLQPDNLQAVVAQIELLDKQGKTDESRQLLARQLAAHPESAYLQHALGMWLLHHGERAYALLGLSKAVELEPSNQDYRYDLATTLHAQEELEAAPAPVGRNHPAPPGQSQGTGAASHLLDRKRPIAERPSAAGAVGTTKPG